MIGRRVVIAAAGAALLSLGLPAAAASGDLDTAFSGDGKTTVSFPNGASGWSGALQGSQAIVGGTSGAPGDTDIALARLTRRGRLDRSFGHRGRVRIDVAGQVDTIGELAVLGNGKIVVVGSARVGGDTRVVVIRLKPDGGFDRTFGGDGVVVIDTSGGASGAAVVPLSRGRIAVGGPTGDPGGTSMLLVRLLADGRLDRSFSGDGRATVGFATRPYTGVTDLARHGSGDGLLAIGDAGGGAGSDVAIAGVDADGSLADDFGGGDGKALLDLGANDFAGGIVPQSLGYFIVTGYTDGGGTGGWDPVVARFNASGHPDLAWGGGDGVVYHDTGATLEYWFGATAQGQKVLMAGQVDGDAAVLRLRASGSVDGSFGSGGLAFAPYSGGDSIFRAVAAMRDGRLVAVGTAPATLVVDGIAVARFLGS
jgi:uncharacterized delta-60 repeat protein